LLTPTQKQSPCGHGRQAAAEHSRNCVSSDRGTAQRAPRRLLACSPHRAGSCALRATPRRAGTHQPRLFRVLVLEGAAAPVLIREPQVCIVDGHLPAPRAPRLPSPEPWRPSSQKAREVEEFADLRFLLQDSPLGFASSWSVDVSMPRLGSVSALALAALLLIATGSAHACPAGVRHCPGSCPPVRPPGRRRCQAASRVPDGASSACDVGCDGRGPRHPLRRNPSPTARRHAPSCPSARHRPRAC